MKTILLFAILVQSIFVFADICDKYETSKSFINTKIEVDNKIIQFSNKKVVAKQADAVMSRLISAKSPVIVNWIAKRDLNTKSEDQIVHEWREYFARNFILIKYPQNNKEIDQEIEKLLNDINQSLFSKEFNKKLEALFLKSKLAGMKLINELPLSEENKQALLTKVNKISLYWMKDFKSSKFTKLPLEFLDWGIAYDPTTNEINIGLNALSYPNDETYLAVFAHEIGHSFDSCRWGAYFKGQWPFQSVGECLRTSESVKALRRDDSLLEKLVQSKKLPLELAEDLKKNPTCNKIDYPPMGFQSDQLPEAFADWFSAEVLAKMPEINKWTIKNIRMDLCEKKELMPGSSYPKNEERLGKIYFVHPKIRSFLQVSGEKIVKYCAF